MLTPVYDTALEVLGFGRSFKAAVAELAEVEPGKTVLDSSCGTGTLLQALVEGYAQDLPLPGQAVNLVISMLSSITFRTR